METNQAGKPSSDVPTVPPWERVWNDVKAAVMPSVVTETPKAARLVPWERFWGSSKEQASTAPSRPLTAPPKSQEPTNKSGYSQLYANEGIMKAAMTNRPGEFVAKEPTNAQNLADVDKELARKNLDPKIQAILLEQRKK